MSKRKALSNFVLQERRNHLAVLITQGFDDSYLTEHNAVRIACSQCEALVINGVATHEHGCPNRTHECLKCMTPIPIRQRLCESCADDLWLRGR